MLTTNPTGILDSLAPGSGGLQDIGGLGASASPILLDPGRTSSPQIPADRALCGPSITRYINRSVFVDEPYHLIDLARPLDPPTGSNEHLEGFDFGKTLNFRAVSTEPFSSPKSISPPDSAIEMKEPLPNESPTTAQGFGSTNFRPSRVSCRDTPADSPNKCSGGGLSVSQMIPQSASYCPSDTAELHILLRTQYQMSENMSMVVPSALVNDQKDHYISDSPRNPQATKTRPPPLMATGPDLKLSKQITQGRFLQFGTQPNPTKIGPNAKLDLDYTPEPLQANASLQPQMPNKNPGKILHPVPESTLQVKSNVQLQSRGPSCSKLGGDALDTRYQNDQMLAYLPSISSKHESLGMPFENGQRQPQQKARAPHCQNRSFIPQDKAQTMVSHPNTHGGVDPAPMHLMNKVDSNTFSQTKAQAARSHPSIPGGTIPASMDQIGQMSSDLYARRSRRMAQVGRENSSLLAGQVGPASSQPTQPPQGQVREPFYQIPPPIPQDNTQLTGADFIISREMIHPQMDQVCQVRPSVYAQQPRQIAQMEQKNPNFHPQQAGPFRSQKAPKVGQPLQQIRLPVYQDSVVHQKNTQETISHTNTPGTVTPTLIQQVNEVNPSFSTQKSGPIVQADPSNTILQAHQTGYFPSQQVKNAQSPQQARQTGYQSSPPTAKNKTQGAKSYTVISGVMAPNPMHPMNQMSLGSNTQQFKQMTQTNRENSSLQANQTRPAQGQQIQDIQQPGRQWQANPSGYPILLPPPQINTQEMGSYSGASAPADSPQMIQLNLNKYAQPRQAVQTNQRTTSLSTNSDGTTHIQTRFYRNSPSISKTGTEITETKISRPIILPEVDQIDPKNHAQLKKMTRMRSDTNLHAHQPGPAHSQSAQNLESLMQQTLPSFGIEPHPTHRNIIPEESSHPKPTRKRKQLKKDQERANEPADQASPKRRYTITHATQDNPNPTKPLQDSLKPPPQTPRRPVQLVHRNSSLISQSNIDSSIPHPEPPVNKDQSVVEIGHLNVDEHAEPARPNRKQAAYRKKQRILSQANQASMITCPPEASPGSILSQATPVLPQEQLDHQQEKYLEHARFQQFQQHQQHCRQQFEQHQRLQQQKFRQQNQQQLPTQEQYLIHHPQLPQKKPKPQNQQLVQKRPAQEEQRQQLIQQQRRSRQERVQLEESQNCQRQQLQRQPEVQQFVPLSYPNQFSVPRRPGWTTNDLAVAGHQRSGVQGLESQKCQNPR